MEFTMESGTRFGFEFSRFFERLDAGFDIRRDGSIVIPAGVYRDLASRLWINTNRALPVSGEFDITYEGFWTGTRTQFQTSTTLRPAPGINITGAWAHSIVDLAEGSFTTDLLRIRGNFDFTPFLSITSVIQYDTLSELVGLYQRLRWIIRPGADIYLVYTNNWLNESDRLRPLETSGSVKVSYTYRF
jgi:hypothetical protein